MRDLATLDIRVDPDPPDPVVLASRAIESGLSAYDAAYLDLAHRVALPLATQDSSLTRAARLYGVDVLTAA